MSEYQYYEFIALDHLLDATQMRELRALSTRAEITATRFTNVYHFGSFKGDPAAMMRDYFDAMVYVTNWGSRTFMVRLPCSAVDLDLAQRYAVPNALNLDTTDQHVVLCFDGSIEDWGDDFDDEEGWMPRLVHVRSVLLAADARPLYLAWLLGIQREDLDDDVVEPPIPPGLADLPLALSELARFLWLDVDILAAAAEASSALTTDSSAIAEWIAALTAADKDRLLARVAAGEGTAVAAELLRRFRTLAASGAGTADEPARRTVGAILEAAERQRAIREVEEARLAAAEASRREAVAAAALAKRMDALARRGAMAWRDVEQRIERMQPAAYDEAVAMLRDLRALAEQEQTSREFQQRLGTLRERHARKRAFIERLDRSGLR